MHAELRFDGIRVGRKRVERLMRAQKLSGLVRRRRGRTTIRVPGVRVANDLVGRDFTAPAPNRLWVADMERHEALSNRAVVRGRRLRSVAAGR